MSVLQTKYNYMSYADKIQLCEFCRQNTTTSYQIHLLKKQDHITAKDPRPPWHFLYLREEGEEEEGKKVSLKTHATTRGMGKNI